MTGPPEAMLVCDDTVRRVGDLTELEAVADNDTVFTDLQGRTLTASFIEAQ